MRGFPCKIHWEFRPFCWYGEIEKIIIADKKGDILGDVFGDFSKQNQYYAIPIQFFERRIVWG